MSDEHDVSSATRYFEGEKNFGECGVCLCQWRDPLELIPCRHIYCKNCLGDLHECPECCTAIERTQTPNLALLELQKSMKGKCSACVWRGTYGEFLETHVKCLSKPRKIATPMLADNTNNCHGAKECLLEELCVPNGGTFHKNDLGSQEKSQHVVDTSNKAFPGYISNHLRDASTPCYSDVRLSRWKGSTSCIASDYGLAEEEFTFLVDNWVEFAAYNPRKDDLELYWCDATRLLRYMNLPSHPNDVVELFHMAMQLEENGSIPFHVFCLWISLSRRNPEGLYKLDHDGYLSLLRYAHVIDVGKTGLFDEEQCKCLGEQMLMRDLTQSEWQGILPLLITSSSKFRNSMPLRYQDSLVSGMSVRLPLHEVILFYMGIIDPASKTIVLEHRQEEREQGDGDSLRATVEQRITSMLYCYNPFALASIDELLRQHKGHEDTLLTTLVEAYGPEPH